MTLSIAVKNGKAPSLSRTGKHRWTIRRHPLVKHLMTPRPDALALIESGSGADLTWWKRALKKYGFTWAKGGGYWQNAFLGPRARFIAGGTRHQPHGTKYRLRGDDKPITWTVFEFAGQRYTLVIVHPENEGGNTRAADKLRYNQIRFGMTVGVDEGHKHGVSVEHLMIATDSNSPSGRVRAWIHRYTDFRDAFSLAAHTSGGQYVSNNKWSLRRVKGKRIDFLFLHKSMKGKVLRALNRAAHADADHDEQYVELDV